VDLQAQILPKMISRVDLGPIIEDQESILVIIRCFVYGLISILRWRFFTKIAFAIKVTITFSIVL